MVVVVVVFVFRRLESKKAEFLAAGKAFEAILYPSPDLNEKLFNSYEFPVEDTSIHASALSNREALLSEEQKHCTNRLFNPTVNLAPEGRRTSSGIHTSETDWSCHSADRRGQDDIKQELWEEEGKRRNND